MSDIPMTTGIPLYRKSRERPCTCSQCDGGKCMVETDTRTFHGQPLCTACANGHHRTHAPLDKQVDLIERTIHPEGRCLDCGGGFPYWKHGTGNGQHPFRAPPA